MRLTTEEREGQPDRQTAAREKHEGRDTAASAAAGFSTLLVPAITARLNGPMILPAPLAPWPRPEARAPMRTP